MRILKVTDYAALSIQTVHVFKAIHINIKRLLSTGGGGGGGGFHIAKNVSSMKSCFVVFKRSLYFFTGSYVLRKYCLCVIQHLVQENHNRQTKKLKQYLLGYEYKIAQ